MCTSDNLFAHFSENSRLFRKISEDYRRFPKTAEDVRRLPRYVCTAKSSKILRYLEMRRLPEEFNLLCVDA